MATSIKPKIDWNDGEFDMGVKEAWEQGVFNDVKWTEANTKIMVRGIFTLWTL